MKRLIYEPAPGEEVPDTKVTVGYTLPVAGVYVCDCIVPDDFTTSGTIHYDSTVTIPAQFDSDGNLISPSVIAKELTEPPVHHFVGWEF